MPRKHVRFAQENTFYSPPPSLSSSSGSGSSVSSSPGPVTPPSLPLIRLPYSPIPAKRLSLPTQPYSPVTGSVVINPILRFSPRSRPPINYDLTLPPETISTHHKALSVRTLGEPATTPSLPQLTLICPYLPWMITVFAAGTDQYSRTHPLPYVTVQDVLSSLYAALQNQVNEVEYDALPSRDARKRVTEAYEARYGKMGWKGTTAYEDERKRGLKRVDFLMERKMFFGLSASDRGQDVWVLNVGL